MVSEDEPIAERYKAEWVLALAGMRDLAAEALDNVNEGQFQMAVNALDLIWKGALPLRNAIGQWFDSVGCPRCGNVGPNNAAIRQGDKGGMGLADIGFRCSFCKWEWGFDVLDDAQRT